MSLQTPLLSFGRSIKNPESRTLTPPDRTSEQVEEERRLLYVGFTRAKERSLPLLLLLRLYDSHPIRRDEEPSAEFDSNHWIREQKCPHRDGDRG
jgi:superfamily I DNA/RNA helicase